jgi:outer membrane protein insertion porin family
VYDPDRLEYDKELLRRHYVSNGYADFQVKSALAAITRDKEAFVLTFAVDEGKKYNFGTINITSNLPGVDVEALKGKLTTVEGETFNATEMENSVEALIKELGNVGYAFVDVDPVMERDEANRVININFTVGEGPRVYVERINIFGNVRTLDEVIRREFRLAEGDPYNTSQISRSEERIRNLGFFEKVKVTNSRGSQPDRTAINVQVEEKSTGEVTFGAGFSSVDGALADIGIRESNLLGKGQDLRARLMIASRRQQVDLGFTEPYFLDRDIAAGFDIYQIAQDWRTESSFDREIRGVTLRADYALSERWRNAVNYSIKENTVADVSADASRFIKDQAGTTVSSIVGHSFTYDKRDNRFDPTAGYFLKVSQDVAGLGGDAKFLRHEGQASYFYSFRPLWTLEISGAAGHMFGLDDDKVRINDRFFVGGRTMRGFENAGMGPRDITTDDALGGNIYYTGTMELRFPLGLPEELGILGAVFTDVGSLWDVDDNGSEVVDSDTLRASVGIRLDFAQAVQKEDFDQTEVFRFSFGTRF